jgi:streptolysin S family bacteriocin protoxin
MAASGVHGLLGALLSTDNDVRSKAEVRPAGCCCVSFTVPHSGEL